MWSRPPLLFTAPWRRAPAASAWRTPEPLRVWPSHRARQRPSAPPLSPLPALLLHPPPRPATAPAAGSVPPPCWCVLACQLPTPCPRRCPSAPTFKPLPSPVSNPLVRPGAGSCPAGWTRPTAHPFFVAATTGFITTMAFPTGSTAVVTFLTRSTIPLTESRLHSWIRRCRGLLGQIRLPPYIPLASVAPLTDADTCAGAGLPSGAPRRPKT